MKIAIETTSELKVRALKSSLEKLEISAEVECLKTNSGVSDQPFGYEEMLLGARNRVKDVSDSLKPDIAVAVESGLVKINDNYFDVACIVVLSGGEESVSYSAGYLVPQWMIDEIKEKGIELGFITQRLSGDVDKDSLKYFSDSKLKREELLSQAITVALVGIFNKDKYVKK